MNVNDPFDSFNKNFENNPIELEIMSEVPNKIEVSQEEEISLVKSTEQVELDRGSVKSSCPSDKEHVADQHTTTEMEKPATAVLSGKVEILLNACGDAPIMKKKRWSVDEYRSVAWVCAFIRKFCKLPKSDSLFLYVNQAFAPSPDETLKNLYSCFGSDNLLILHYSKSQAWG